MVHAIRDEEVVIAAGGSLNGGTVKKAARVTTADATATDIIAIPLAEGEAIVLTGFLVGCQSDQSNAITAHFEACARRAAAGNVTLVGTPACRILEDDTNTNVTVNADTTAQTLDVRVVGIAAETWRWEAKYEYTKV
jgi:hypothetical protein